MVKMANGKCILGEFTLVLGECRKFVGKKIGDSPKG